MTGADTFSPPQRSAIMRAVKSHGTKPERLVRRVVCELGFARRYRLNGAKLPGKPDLVFGALRKTVFVHGCFWHGHACARGDRMPKTNSAYWRAKISKNRERDAAARKALSTAGWSSFVIWECQLREGRAWRARLSRYLGQAQERPRAPRSKA